MINWDIGGEVVKEDERYIVKDNTELNNLVVSSTRLKLRKAQQVIDTLDKKKFISLFEAVVKWN